MLPILRILPVGGVLLAILILVLALSPPDGSRAPLSSAMATSARYSGRSRSPVRNAAISHPRRPQARRRTEPPARPSGHRRALRRGATESRRAAQSTGLTPIRKKPPRLPRRRSSASRSRLANPPQSNCRPSHRKRCRRLSRKRKHRSSRKPSRPNRSGKRAAASIAHARRQGSPRSRPSLASTISSRCFSGDRRVNKRRTAPKRRLANPTSSRPTPRNISNLRMAASSNTISGR